MTVSSTTAEHETVQPYRQSNTDQCGNQHKKPQFLIHIAHLTMLFRPHHGLAELMGDVAGHGHHTVHP